MWVLQFSRFVCSIRSTFREEVVSCMMESGLRMLQSTSAELVLDQKWVILVLLEMVENCDVCLQWNPVGNVEAYHYIAWYLNMVQVLLPNITQRTQLKCLFRLCVLSR